MRMPVIHSAKLRRGLGILLPFLVIPCCVLFFALYSGSVSYAFATFIVTVLALILFLCGFEKRKTGSRRLILVAVMTALSVIGRFIFGAIPAFKPITAVVVITAIYLGGESGFLCGALSALISNMYFGQGPWTPFQMLSWGLIGLLAGLLSVPLKRSRLFLSLYGIFAGIAYSFIMDIWTVLWANEGFTASLYITALSTAVPYTVMYAVSNVVFLNLLAKPFGRKLERIKIKYGC